MPVQGCRDRELDVLICRAIMVAFCAIVMADRQKPVICNMVSELDRMDDPAS